MRNLLLALVLLLPILGGSSDHPAMAREQAAVAALQRKLQIVEKNLRTLEEMQRAVREKLAVIGARLVALGRELTGVGSDDARRTAVSLEVGRLQGDLRALEERLRGLGRAMAPFRAEADRLRTLL